MIKVEKTVIKKQPKFWNHVLFHPTDAIEDPWGKRILDRMAADGAIGTIRIYSMFEDIVYATQQLRNKALQEAMLEIRYKYGKNSILRGISYTPASTARERNNQIGGHKSGNEDSKGAHAKVKTG